MTGIDSRAAKAAWSVFLVGLAIAAVWLLRSTLAVFAFSLLFAYMLMPVVKLVDRFTPHHISRTVSLAFVYLVLVGLLVFAGVTIGSRIAEEAGSLASQLPRLVKDQLWQSSIPLPAWLEPQRARMAEVVRNEINRSEEDVVPYLKTLGSQVVAGARFLGYFVLVPILAFFFLKDGRTLLDDAVEHVPSGPKRSMVRGILGDIDTLLGQYIRALVLQALSAFALYSLFLGFTGAPYAVLLAGIAAPLEFIPVMGPLAAGVITAFVAGIAGYTHLVWFLLFWVVMRGFQDYVLIPFLLGAGIEMDPLLVLFGVLAGEQLGGVEGMIFSVPLLAILRVVFVRLVGKSRSVRIRVPAEPVE